ncbi:hypothetical protein [Streptomyces sp. NPDC002187]|uniref:hypothetical protein n=1 Tax=Streptomyces sp. NPDC002187 TaxID=3364637 RepID=UPI0036972840
MLEGIDDIDWAGLEHAYGPADDVPDLLRAAQSADEDEQERAFEDLFSSLCHQGSIYSATAAAVPFLAQLALHGSGDRVRMLWLLGGAADGNGREYLQVRRAVAEVMPSLLGLAADGEDAVRKAMVWLISVCDDYALPLLPLLRARLDEENDPGIRADIVTALGLLDPSDDARTARARALLAAPEALVRRAAAVDLLRTAPLPLPVDLVDLALDTYDGEPALEADAPWPEHYRSLDERLLDDPDAALRAVARGMPLASAITRIWRDREQDVLPWLVASVEGPYDLRDIAREAAAVDGGGPAPWLEVHLRSPQPQMRVAATLVAVRLRVPDALGLVLRLMDEVPGTEGVADAVRAAVEVYGAAAEPVALRVLARPRSEWLGVLGDFPALAAASVDDLVRLLPHSAGVLGSLGADAGPAATRALLGHARKGSKEAALAYARVTADPSVVVAALRTDLAEGNGVHTAGELGPLAAGLLPEIEAQLARPWWHVQAAAALAIWRITGRTEDTAPVLAERLARTDRFAPHHLEWLRALRDMALLPDIARPTVERFAYSARRVMSPDILNGTAPHADYEARALARELLAAVAH